MLIVKYALQFFIILTVSSAFSSSLKPVPFVLLLGFLLALNSVCII